MINCNGKLLDLETPIVMGILNLTPDSFFDGGKYKNEKKVLERVEEILKEGGEIIDLGAVSTRPKSKNITAEEELKRLNNFVKIIRNNFPDAILSLDTFRSDIAEKMVNDYKIDIINDISGGTLDAKMFETIANLKVPYIMTHIQGNPQNMNKKVNYKNLMMDINLFFAKKLDKLKKLGVNDVILDPGFGFGKTLQQNYKILSFLENFKIFDLPILVGLSRKSMIFNLLNSTSEKALNGTTVVNTIALQKGANILRVHDVKEAVESIKILSEIN